MTVAALMVERPWKPIRDCPGRYVLPPMNETPAEIAGADASSHEHQPPTARDPVVVVPLADGGIISYRRTDGRYVHTLNTAEGFERKLRQLGILEPE